MVETAVPDRIKNFAELSTNRRPFAVTQSDNVNIIKHSIDVDIEPSKLTEQLDYLSKTKGGNRNILDPSCVGCATQQALQSRDKMVVLGIDDIQGDFAHAIAVEFRQGTDILKSNVVDPTNIGLAVTGAGKKLQLGDYLRSLAYGRTDYPGIIISYSFVPGRVSVFDLKAYWK